MDVGARIWIAESADERVWLAARVIEMSTGSMTVELEEKTNEMASRDETSESNRREVSLVLTPSGECLNVLPRNMPREQDQQDLVALPHLHEASILNALRLRYERHAIYTHIGEILISINPFESLPELYGDNVLQSYVYDHEAHFGDRVTSMEQREPHLFAVARAAYVDIIQNARSQSILISGESGAGKTEATKIIMTYFAVTCGTNVTGATTNISIPSYTTIEEQVLQSNPILEAFGNARTVRNDNSSRFGKFIELRFRDNRRRLAGARIRTYLLEKIRVIKQAPHERNFHIFYELLSADTTCVSDEQKQRLALTGGPSSFRLLNQSLCSKRRDGVKDSDQFRSTKRAMHQLGLSEGEISGVLEIVAAVLHMGNVDFEPVPYKREDNVFVDEARVVSAVSGTCNHFTKAAELLGVTTEALDCALTKRWLHASNETLIVGVDVAHASNTRNAITMECYRLLFEWLVARVNSKLEREATLPLETDHDEEISPVFIGLLDIFGFEDMAENSFEQLCINYANEALQHQFNQYIFEEEQRLYRDEGIRWDFIDFPNNCACLELFEQRPIGIFSLTDQECVFPQGTDRALITKYYLEFEKKIQHPHFRSPAVIQRTKQFVVAHYAGCVTYTVEGFLAKNKDSFCESAARLLAGSSNPLIQALAVGSIKTSALGTDIEAFGGRNRRRATSAIAAVSVGTQFKIQLTELLTTVRATTPRYVRCIKPNDTHVGSLFQSTRVVEQLRSGGVLEAVRVARAGFPVRLSHQQFLGRYCRVLLSHCKVSSDNVKNKGMSMNDLELCLHQLTQVLVMDTDDSQDEDQQNRCGVSLGKTRVFLRRKPYEKLENLRAIVRQNASLVIQKNVKRFVARRNYCQLRQVTITVQARVRGRRAYHQVCWMRAMLQARILQARMRQLCARSRFLRARAGVLAIQCRFRCRRASRIVQARREARSVTRIASCWRRSSAQRKYHKLCSATLALQCAMRVRIAKRTLKALREESRNIAKLTQDNAQLKDELAQLRRQMEDIVAQSAAKERQQVAVTFPSIKKIDFCKSPEKDVVEFSENSLAEDCSNQHDCDDQLELELSEDLIATMGGNPNAANGRDVNCVLDVSFNQQKTRTSMRRPRRYSLPPLLASANEEAEFEDVTPPVSPRAPRVRDRRHSLDLWRLQEVEAQQEAQQLREEIREAAAEKPSPERQQQQELALQKLVASQIKRKTMQLQLLPEVGLKIDNNSIVPGPASCISHRRRSRTVDNSLSIPAPLTSCGRHGSSRWNFAAPHSMTHASSSSNPYFDSPNYAGSSYGDDRSIEGDDYMFNRGRDPMPRRSASTGMYRSRSSSNASTCGVPPSGCVRPGVVVPRFTKAPTCYECDCEFGLFVHRHHCRQCGNSFCFEHSTRQLALPHLGYVAAQRVCDACFETHIQAMTSFKLPSLIRHPTDELSSFTSSPRGLECNDNYSFDDSPSETIARVAPLHT